MLSITKKTIAIAMCLSIAGCAGNPDKMVPSYVSPIAYNNYTCAQLDVEEKKVSRKADELYGHLKKEADADAAQMFVGLVLFWPALFFLEGGDGPEASQYTQLKGKYKALTEAQKAKNCGTLAPQAQETTTATSPVDHNTIQQTEKPFKDPSKVDYLYLVENKCTTQKYYLKNYAHKVTNIPDVINKKVKTYNYGCLTDTMEEKGKKVHTLENFNTLMKIDRNDTIIHFM